MTTVIVADDHTLVREGIHALLDREGDIQVIGEAADGQEAVTLVEKLKPDVLLIDLSMPRLNGIEAIQRLHESGSKTRVIALSMHADEVMVLRALRGGARGYLLKDSFKEELFFALRAVVRGEIFLSPKLAESVLNDLITGTAVVPVENPIERLSTREREVLQQILEGKTNRQISALLQISIKTVDKHRTNLMKKLDVHDVTGLMHLAVQHGILYVRP